VTPFKRTPKTVAQSARHTDYFKLSSAQSTFEKVEADTGKTKQFREQQYLPDQISSELIFLHQFPPPPPYQLTIFPTAFCVYPEQPPLSRPINLLAAILDQSTQKF